MIERYISSVWALEPQFHNTMFSIAMKRLAQGKEPIYISEKAREEALKAARPQKKAVSGRVSGLNVAGNVMVISIDGAMTRTGDLCSYGTEQISAWIAQANADADVNAIKLKINSGGGDVDGLEQLAEAVKTSKKPVVAFVAGMAASAAYWVASQATEVVMETATTSSVGSIGVLAVHVDATKALEQEGYKINIVRADGSEDKALWNDAEPLSAQVLADAKASLNLVRETFISAVKSGRPKISEDVFTGKMFEGTTAIKKGMADKVGNAEFALQRAMYHARKQELNQSKNNQSKAMGYEKLSAVLGGEVPSGMADETALALESALTEKDKKISELEAGKKKTEGELKTAQEEKTRLDTELKEKSGKLKEYEDTKVSAKEIPVLKTWYDSAKRAGATGIQKDVNDDKPVRVSRATAIAQKAYNELHGSKKEE